MKNGLTTLVRFQQIFAVTMAFAGVGFSQAGNGLSTYSMVWKATQPSKLDLGREQPRPAGQGGFITIGLEIHLKYPGAKIR